MIHIKSKKTRLLALIVLSAIWLLFNFVVFPYFGMFYGGTKQPILDLRIFYSYQDVMLLFNELGASGRMMYLWQLAVADMVYPLVYASLLIILMQMVYVKQRQWMLFIPMTVALADIIENMQIIMMLYHFPAVGTLLPLTASVFTFAKWLLAVTVIIVLVIGLIKRYRRKEN